MTVERPIHMQAKNGALYHYYPSAIRTCRRSLGKREQLLAVAGGSGALSRVEGPLARDDRQARGRIGKYCSERGSYVLGCFAGLSPRLGREGGEGGF